jgi:hypothetical protein
MPPPESPCTCPRPSSFRDRDGKHITGREWSALWEDLDYRIIEDTDVDGVLVRTVWEGLSIGDKPLFYTGVRREEHWDTVGSAPTLAEARAAHQAAVRDQARRAQEAS